MSDLSVSFVPQCPLSLGVLCPARVLDYVLRDGFGPHLVCLFADPSLFPPFFVWVPCVGGLTNQDFPLFSIICILFYFPDSSDILILSLYFVDTVPFSGVTRNGLKLWPKYVIELTTLISCPR